jgi:sialate O-acetylesterase
MKLSACPLLALLLAAGIPSAHATVTPNPLFADHAVLQQGTKVPVWGTAEPGEAVTVEIAGQTATTTTGRKGKWLVRLAPMEAGGPHTLTISGKNRIVLADILVGEVWVCGGQSNMERQLGPRPGQQPIVDWQKEVAAANHPQIRHFAVGRANSLVPLTTVEGQWAVCTPETVKDFSAVGYFFGRDLHQARHVPVGLIHSSWGGTPAEAWTSEEGLRPLPDFATTPDDLKLLRSDPDASRREHEARLEAWFLANDPSSAPGHLWNDPALDTSTWKTMAVPGLWEDSGEPELKDLNGVVWLRKAFELPAGRARIPAELQLGMIDDEDTTWMNGVKVGTTARYDAVRKYPVPASVLRPGRNVIAVRVLDTGGGGGIWGDKKPQLVFAGGEVAPIDLSGPWQYRIGMNLEGASPPPMGVGGDVETPTVLWNGMIAPLVPYAIRGVIWYQGEANVYRARQYRTLFPAMIAGWRQAWGQGNFPFLFVQIAPFRDMTPELREAQLISWQHTRNTAMAVTIDCGDANDIHPTRKQPVSARLALAARVLAYGEALEYSGPVFDSMKIEGQKATLRFTHLDGGLRAKGGPLRGFTLAGADKVFHPARAEIRGRTVVVTSKAVPQPVAVRYGWANVPEGNLWNKAGLPASPFRTDSD